MAISVDNLILHGLHGKIGKQIVVRKRNGQTIVSCFPVKSSKITAEQQEQQQKFKNATVYAKSVIQDPDIRQKYEEVGKKLTKKLSAYATAVKDYLTPDKISDINYSKYNGGVNEKILIYVDSIFTSEVVTLKIQVNGSDFESGDASFENGVWVYRTTKQNNDLKNTKIIVNVIGHLGDKDEKSVALTGK